MESQLNCLKHFSKVLAVCCASKCNDRIACSKCLVFNHKECNDNFIFLEDLEADNLGNILQIPIFGNVFPKQEYKELFTPSEDSVYRDSISSILAELLDKLKEIINKFDNKLLFLFRNHNQTPDFVPQIKKILELDALKNKFATVPANKLNDSLAKLKIYDYEKAKVVQDLRNYKEIIVQDIESSHSIKNLRLLTNKIAAKVEQVLRTESVVRKTVKFDVGNSTHLHFLRKGETSLEHAGKEAETGVTQLNIRMAPYTGIYRWNCVFTNLKGYSKHDHYAFCGLLSKSSNENEKTNFVSRAKIAFCSREKGIGKLANSGFPLVLDSEGKLIEFVFDSDNAVFMAFIEGKLIYEFSEIKRIEHRPYILTRHRENVCTIVQ